MTWRVSHGSAPPARTWAGGAAGPGPVQRARLPLTREEAGRLIADQQELIRRYQREAAGAPAGARTVILGFLAYPEPAPDADPAMPGEPAGQASSSYPE